MRLHLQSTKLLPTNSRQKWWRKRWPNKRTYIHLYTTHTQDVYIHTIYKRYIQMYIHAYDLCASCSSSSRNSNINSSALVTSALSVLFRFVYFCVSVCWLAKSGQWTTLNFGAAAESAPGQQQQQLLCVMCSLLLQKNAYYKFNCNFKWHQMQILLFLPSLRPSFRSFCLNSC